MRFIRVKLLTIFGGFAVILVWIALVRISFKWLLVYNMFGGDSFTKLGSFFFGCIWAPIWEEAAFRHAPLQLAKKLGKVSGKNLILPISLISSGFFGWGHGDGPVSVLIQGMGGMVLCFVYIKNGYCY